MILICYRDEMLLLRDGSQFFKDGMPKIQEGECDIAELQRVRSSNA